MTSPTLMKLPASSKAPEAPAARPLLHALKSLDFIDVIELLAVALTVWTAVVIWISAYRISTAATESSWGWALLLGHAFSTHRDVLAGVVGPFLWQSAGKAP